MSDHEVAVPASALGETMLAADQPTLIIRARNAAHPAIMRKDRWICCGWVASRKSMLSGVQV
jgi:hypothetical protein